MLQKRSGISKTHINDIENNYKIPSIIVAEKIARALNVDISEIYKLEI